MKNIELIKDALELQAALSKLEVNWMAIGGSFEIEEARKRVIVRSRTSLLSLTESIKMEEEMEREKMNQFLKS